MATIKDIARAANVSSGTVSNVLNRKGNVTEEKIRRVEEAVMRLGYEVNESAKILRQKTRNSIAVIVPNFRGRHYLELYETLTKNFAPYDYDVSTYYTNNLHEREQELIRRVISQNVSCIVAFPTYIDEGRIYDKIPSNIHLVLVGPRPTRTTRPYLQLSFDYEKIAHDISDYVISRHYKNVDIFIDSVRFSRDFLYIILQRLSRAGISVRHFGSTTKTILPRALDMFDPGGKVDAVITSNTQRAETVRKVYSFLLPEHIPEIISLSPSRTVVEDEYTYVHLDYQKIGNLITDSFMTLIKSKKSVEGSYIVECDNIVKRDISTGYRHSGVELKLLAAEDPCSTYLEKVLSQFEDTTGIKVKIRYYSKNASVNEVLALAGTGYDLLISDYRNRRMLTRSGVFLMEEKAPDVIRRVRDLEKEADTYFQERNGKCAYLSFNTSCQMLFYRRDLFKEQKIVRRYYEKVYKELRPPETTEEYDDLAAFFAESFAGEGNQRYGVSMSSFGSDNFWKELYYRLRAEGISARGRDKRIPSREELSESIRRYFRVLKMSNIGEAYHVSDAAEDFIRGNSMMSIFSTSETKMFNDNKYDHFRDNVACCDVPGGIPVVDSNIVGILGGTEHVEEACEFLQWLYRKSICNILTALSGQPIIKSSVFNTQILELYPWLKYYNRNVERGFFIEDCFSEISADPENRKKMVSLLTDAYINPTQLENLAEYLLSQLE